ncbi:MAG: EAL domain-containing protein [Actinomycetota bacterium]
MTDSPPLLTTGRRQRMRHLRTGELPPPRTERFDPVLTGGRAPSEHAFLTSLGHAIANAGAVGARILVFRARARAVHLHKWSEPAGPSANELDEAIEAQLLAVDPALVLLRRGSDVLGFASRPCDRGQAEHLGGALAAALVVVHGDSAPVVGLSSRLGVAAVDGSTAAPSELAVAVAEAVEAVERTIAETTDETPYLIHNDYIVRRSRRHDDIGAAIAQAISERQITLEFQPRVGVAGLVPVGLEVFPRWRHPQLGPIPTVDFLRVAERDGLLGQLGRQVRGDALGMARRWASEGTLGPRRLWFDLAPIELLDRHFLDEIESLAANGGTVNGGNVTIGIELTDAPVLEEAVFAPVFEALEELEVQIALDNLRPAGLSLGRIQRLPVNVVNLDREVVRSLRTDGGQRDLVRLICGFANDRGIAVTACQVETAEELALVGELGVDQVQGYAVSEPLAEADLWPQLDRPMARAEA